MNDEENTNTDSKVVKRGSGNWRKIILLLSAGAIMAVARIQYGEALSLQNLATQEAGLRAYQQNNPALVYGAAWLVYVAVTGLSLPGASILTLAFGWYFGFWRGLVLVSFASTAGATLAFVLSRYLLRNAIQSRFGERLAGFNAALEREGAFYLFTLRLIPAVPFFVINFVMGLTPIRAWTFWWVSQVGMFAGTAVFVYAGASMPNMEALAERGTRGIVSPRLIVAFVLLGLFPIVVKKVMQRFCPSADDSARQPLRSVDKPTEVA